MGGGASKDGLAGSSPGSKGRTNLLEMKKDAKAAGKAEIAKSDSSIRKSLLQQLERTVTGSAAAHVGVDHKEKSKRRTRHMSIPGPLSMEAMSAHEASMHEDTCSPSPSGHEFTSSRRSSTSLLDDLHHAQNLNHMAGVQLYSKGLSAFLRAHDPTNTFDASGVAKDDPALQAIRKAMETTVFEGMPEEAVQPCIDSFFLEEFQAGESICVEGDKGEKLFAVESGTVEFYVKGKRVGEGSGGTVFGEISLIFGVLRSATCVAMTPCRLWSLNKRSYRLVQAMVARFWLSRHADEERNDPELLRSKWREVQADAESASEQEEDVHIPMENLDILSTIGYGSYGKVQLVTEKGAAPGKVFALKMLSKIGIEESEQEEQVMVERKALFATKSKFVLCMYSTYSDNDYLYMLTDFMQGGDLMEYLMKVRVVDDEAARFYTSNIAQGLAHLHAANFIHRDLKPENVLMQTNGYLKIGDLGLAKELPYAYKGKDGSDKKCYKTYTVCGSPEFMSPEFVLNTGYDHRCDWWALGCVVYEMFFARSPFYTRDGDLSKLYTKICMFGLGRKRLKSMVDNDFAQQNESAVSFIDDLLCQESKRLGREGLADLKTHAWLERINWDDLASHRMSAPYTPPAASSSSTENFNADSSVSSINWSNPKPYRGKCKWAKDF